MRRKIRQNPHLLLFPILVGLVLLAAFSFPSLKKVTTPEVYPQAQLSLPKQDFKATDKVEFLLNLNDGSLRKAFGPGQVWADDQTPRTGRWSEGNTSIKAQIVYNGAENLNTPLTITRQDANTFLLSVEAEQDAIKPGKYQVQVELEKDGVTRNLTQDFTWGVLAVNTNKSVYRENEEAKIFFGVLDEKGATICNAQLQVEIKNPQGETVLLSTQNDKIRYSGQCQGDNITDIPDYQAIYKVGTTGTYQLTVKAKTDNGEYTITDSFDVTQSTLFDVERIGPTRINPTAKYDFTIKVTASENFTGQIKEAFPKDFNITGKSFETKEENGKKVITWNTTLIKGQTTELSYAFDAPDISPEFFLLGPLQFIDSTAGQTVFEEIRQWQIASDAVTNMILMWDPANGSIPSNWTCISCQVGDPFYQTFIRGNSSYSGTSGSATHDHTANASTGASTSGGTGTGATGNNTSAGYPPLAGHTHDAPTLSGLNGSNLPSYRNLQVIRYNYGIPSTLPQNVIAIFDAAAPSGWTTTGLNDSRYVRGENSGGTGGSNTHTHSVSGTSAAAAASAIRARTGSSATIAANGHTHSISSQTSAAGSSEPAYMTVVLAKKDASGTIPSGMIAMFDATAPSGSWTARSAQSGDPFYLRSFKPTGTYGTSSDTTTHNHTNLSLPASQTGNTIGINATGTTYSDTAHTHSYTLNFGTAVDQSPPMVDAIFAKASSVPAPTLDQIHYHWRNDDNDEANATSATSGTEDTAIGGYPVQGNRRLRIEVSNEGNAAVEGAQFRLEYSPKGSDCTTASGWTDVGAIGGDWDMHNTTNLTDGDDTTNIAVSSGGVSNENVNFVSDNNSVKDTSSQTAGMTMSYEDYVELEYSIKANAGASGAYCFRVTNAGSTTNLSYTRYPEATMQSTFSISGNIYSDESTAYNCAVSGNLTVNAKVNGWAGTGTTTCNDAGGAYTISGIPLSGGEAITIYIDNASFKANTATRGTNPASSLSNIHLYRDRVIVRYEDTGPITNANMGHFDRDDDTNNLLFTSNANTLTVISGVELHVWTGKTYDPNGAVNTNSTGGDFHIDDSATAYLDTATSAIGRDILVDGGATLNIQANTTVGGGDITTSGTSATVTYTNTPTVTVSGTGNIGGGTTPTLSFYNLTISGTQTIASAPTIANDLAANGTMQGSVNVTVNGSVAGTGTINMSGGTFEQRVSAAKNFGTTSGSNVWTFSTLMFSNGGGAGYTVTTQAGGSGAINVSTLLQIGKAGDGQATTLNAGNRTWNLTSTNGNPFDLIGSSSLSAGTSTFSYNGNNGGGNTTVQTATYHNLTFNAAETFVPEGALIANNDLTITTGSLTMGANNLTVGSDSYAGDISVAGSQSLTQTASGTTTVKTFNANTGTVGGAGTLTFYNLSLSPTNSGGTIRLGSAAGQTIGVSGSLTAGNGTNTVTVDANTNDPTINVTYDFTINTNATFQSTSGNLTIGGNFANSNVFTHASGTVIMNAGDTGNTLSGNMTGTSSFNNLQFNNASGAWSFGANAATIANNFTITSSAAGGVTAPSTTLTITGNYSNSGTFAHNNGLVLFNAGDTGNTLSGAMTGTSSFYNLEFSNAAGAWSFGANSATVVNNFTITTTTGVGGVTAPSTTLTIGGNFTKSAGTFTHNNGTVTFNDNTKVSTLTYDVATTFYALTSNTASKELHFDNDAQTNVTNNFTINGGACGTKIRLYSDSTPNRWEINVTGGTKSIQYAEIGDSAAIVALSATNSTSLGNSTGWTITGDSCGGVTVSGNAYTDEGTSVWGPCDGNTNNISLVVNGGGSYTASCDDTTGAFAFYTVSTATNQPVSVFFNTNGSNTEKGVAVTVAANGSSNITLNPRLNRVWVTTETGVSSISNANLDHCDSASPAGCANVPYSVTTNALTVISGVELHVQASKTYDPNGTVTTNATGGDLHIDDGATVYLDTATSAIGRDLLVDANSTVNIQATTTVGGGDITTGNSATVTYTNTPTVTVSGTGNIGGGTAPSITFYGLTVSGTQTGTSAITIAGDLTANGTFQGSQNVTVNGSVAGTGTINMSGGTFEQRVSAARNFGTTSGSNAWTFSTLMFSNGGGAGYTVTTQAGGSGGITVATLLQIGKVGDGQTTTLNAGNRTWTLSGTTGTPFDIIGSSSLASGTSTFTFTGNYGSGNTTVQTATYNNLTINGSETYVAEGTLGVNGNLTVTTGTLSMGSNNLNVGSTGVANSGNISVAGSQSLTQTAGTTTVRTSAAGTATIGGAGTLTFYDLAIAPDANGGAITLGSAAGQTITANNLTIGNDTNTVTVNANTYDPTLDVNGSFLINTNATFQASDAGIFNVADDFTNDGTFTHNSGTVTFDTTTTSDITGAANDPTPAITFNSFVSTTAGKTLQFGAGKVIRFEGAFTVTGTSPSKITIKSTSDNNQWKIDHQGTESITYAIVRDSGHLTGSTNVTLDPTDSDGGNNSSAWQFQVGKRIKANVRFKAGVRIK